MASNFASTVGAWAAQSEARIAAVHRRAVELLGEEMAKTKPQGGRVPFLTGNLARSILASTEGMPSTKGGDFPGSNVGLVASGLQPGQAVWIGYQANYARRMNYGFVGEDSTGRSYNQAGNHFVEGAISMWEDLVKQAAEELQSSVEARQG